MANPTTNYSFVLPTSTDLVTDLPADFDVALQGVDTRLKALQPGTTSGDLAYSSATANTNVRLPIGTNGQVLAVVAGVPAWAATADQTPLTTKGDLFTFNTADARLGVGANGTLLTADSAEATGLKWAAGGGMTTLASGSLSSTSLTISSISATFTHLQLIVRDFNTSVDGTSMRLRFNGDSGTRYKRVTVYGNSGVVAFDESSIQYSAGNSNTQADGISVINVLDYANTTTFKACDYLSISNQDGAGTGMQNHVGYGIYNQVAAINSLTIVSGGGNMNGTYILYGVK